jgi:hypothetical protein
MANEITISGQIQYANPAANIAQVSSPPFFNQLFSITGKNFVSGTMSVPTTAGGTAIPVSALSGLGWGAFKNNDSSNYVTLLTAVSGTAFPRIPPGGIAIFYFDSSVTAPAAIANTAAVELQFFILEP